MSSQPRHSISQIAKQRCAGLNSAAERDDSRWRPTRHHAHIPSEVADMAGTLVPYSQFVEVQQRRARIVAPFSRSRETRAECTPPAISDEPIDVGEPPRSDVAATITH